MSYSMNGSSVRCAEALTSFSPATTSRHRRPSRPPTLPAHALRNRRRSHLSWNEYAVRVQKPLHVLHEVEGDVVRRLAEELLAFETDSIFSRDSNPRVFKGRVIAELHKQQLIEHDKKTDCVFLSPKGASYVETTPL